MADSVAGAAAWLGGTEIVNDSRTTAYMRNGIKPGTLSVNGDCGCGNLLELAGCDDEYTTPANDNAPWYDPAIPESAEFAGFLSTEFEGLNSTFTRTVSESITDGATLGRSRFGSRTLTWKGFLFGSSCCGVAYGLRWLGKTLQGSKNCGNNCFGDDLELLVCCPTMEAAMGLGPNVVGNPEFENSLGLWAASGDTAITWTNNPVYTGSGAMKVVNPVGGSITFNTDTSSYEIPVTGNKTYKLSMQVKGGSGTASSEIVATFSWYTDIDAPIGAPVSLTLGSDTNDAWTLLENTITSPLTAAKVRIDFEIGDEFSLANEAHFIGLVNLNQTNYAPVVEPFRTLKGVSLLEGPMILNERKMGSACGGRCGGAAAIEIEFSLVGSQPWLYSAPIPVVSCVKAQANSVPIIGATLTGILNTGITNIITTIISDDFAFLPVISYPGNTYITLDPFGTDGTPEVVRVTAHTAGSATITVNRGQQGTTPRAHSTSTTWTLQTDCSPNNCTTELLSELGFCAPPALPPTATYVGCVIPDVNTWDALYITVPRTLWNSVSEVVPVITIQTGGLPVVNARLGFYTSADGNPCGDLITNPPECDLICDTLYFTAIPGNSKFYIDGRTNTMSTICGTNAAFPGEPLTLGPFSWPSFDCYGFCMEFAYDPRFANDELCVSLSLVPRTAM